MSPEAERATSWVPMVTLPTGMSKSAAAMALPTSEMVRPYCSSRASSSTIRRYSVWALESSTRATPLTPSRIGATVSVR